MKKILVIILSVITLLGLTACGPKKEEQSSNNNETPQKENIEADNGKNETNTAEEEKKQEENVETNKNEEVINDDVYIDEEIVEYDDVDNGPIEDEIVTVEKIINCDGCVFSYFSETKKIGSTLSNDEYTTDINKLRTSGGKQRHNFFGFVLSGNTISKAYSCILKDNKIYCIQGSSNGAYFSSNVAVLNQIFTSDQCKYISNGNTYWCTDGDYNGDTVTTGYAALHYETSCTIYGSEARTGELICH